MVGTRVRVNGQDHIISAVYMMDGMLLAVSFETNTEIQVLDWELTRTNSLLLCLDLGIAEVYRFPFSPGNDLIFGLKNYYLNPHATGNVVDSVDNGIYQVNYDLFIRLIEHYTNRPVKPPKESKVYNYEPYKPNTIVYQKSEDSKLFNQVAGKVIEHLSSMSNGNHKYLVHFLNNGTDHYYHNNLIPTENYFEHSFEQYGFTAKVDCGELFKIGDKFLDVNGYLYNKAHSVILKLDSHKHNFTKHITQQENATIQKPASKIRTQKSTPDILGF